MLSFHITTDPKQPIADAHTMTERIESYLRGQIEGLGRVVIHVEPPGGLEP